MTNTTTNEKAVRITKAMRYEDIMAMVAGELPKNGSTVEDIQSFCAHEMEMLARKNHVSGEKKPTAVQVANERYKEMVKAFLADNPGVTCSAIAKGIPEFDENDFTTSKVNGLLRGLLASGEVVREEKKGKALFSLVTVE